MTFAFVIIMMVLTGFMLSLGAGLLWNTSGRLFIGMAAVASVVAYLAVVLSDGSVPIPLVILIVIGSGALLGLATSFFAFRLTDVEFLLGSLATVEVIRRLLLHTASVTGGSYGIRLTGIVLSDSGASWAFLVIVVVAAVSAGVGMQRFLASPKGIQWLIVGASRDTAALIGVDMNLTERYVGIAVGVLAAMAGLAYVLTIGFIHPNDLSMDMGIAALAAGLMSRNRNIFFGILFASIALFGGRELLRLIEIGGVRRFGWYDVILGIAMVLLAVNYARKGRG